MKKNLLLLFFLIPIFLNPPVYSQKQGKAKVDSLITRLNNYKPEDTVKVGLYRDISFEEYGIDPKLGVKYGEKGIALAEQLNDRKGLVFCLITTGVCYWAASNFPRSLELQLHALKIAEEMGYKIGIAKASGNIGNVYADQKNYPKALEYYNKALKISEELHDVRGIARKLGNIGTIYKEIEPPDYPKALEYYFKALKKYEEAGEKRGIVVTLENISWVYSGQSLYKQAIQYLNRALDIALKIGEPRWIMYYYGTLGEDYYDMATDKSEKYRPTLNSMSKDEKEKSLKRALSYLLQAVETAKRIKASKQMIDWYESVSKVYRATGDWEAAYYYADSSHTINDSVFTRENKIAIANLESRRETEVKQKEIELQATRLEKATIQRIALAGGLIGLIIIILLIYSSKRKSDRLLLNILPAKIAKRLKNREKPIADMFENAAVVFIDIVDFTGFSKDKDPHYIIEVLTDFFGRLDIIGEKYGMEKIKTIGDCYMAVSGLPEPVPESVERAASFAIECRDLMKNYRTRDGQVIHVRIGIDAGAVIAGVIGDVRFSYDLWGDIVNTASRMESLGMEGEVQITERVKVKLNSKFGFRERGELEVKGKGKMNTWWLV